MKIEQVNKEAERQSVISLSPESWPPPPLFSVLAATILLLHLLAACRPATPAPPPTATSSPTPAATATEPAATATPAPPLTPTIVPLFSDQPRFEAEMNLPFFLSKGQTAVIPAENLEIRYVQIIEDSRCPDGEDCEWSGELLIEYEVSKNGESLGLFKLGSNSGGYIINNYVVNIWDYNGETVMVRPYIEKMKRSTSANNPANCTPGQGQLSSYTNPNPPAEETHVVGIYTPGYLPTRSWPGVANIYVNRQKVPLTLVLSAYEPTVFRIHPAEGVEIKQIILNGHGQHQVANVDSVPVLNRSGDWEDYIVAAAHSWNSDDASTLAAEIEAITGKPITSFYGCYEASEFTIN